MFLLVNSLLLLILFVFYFCNWSSFCCAVLSVISSFVIISLEKREREMVA